MVNLSDIAKAARGGMGVQAISREFGLDQDQARRAIEALLPAFTLAFRQMALDPVAFAGLAGAVGSGRYAPYFDGAGVPGPDAPAGIVAQLFGSDEVARRVSAQASATTGIGAQVLQRMLPVLAAMLVGGMSRYASLDGFADFLRQWSDALRAMQPRKFEPKAPDPWSAWSRVVSASLGGSAPKPKAEAPPADPFEAWSRLMTTMVGGGAPPPPPPASPNPAQALATMFESGLDVQAQYVEALQSAFGQAWTKPAE